MLFYFILKKKIGINSARFRLDLAGSNKQF
jgi:hypothetical protein